MGENVDMTELCANFVENLKELLFEQGLTVKELAQKIGAYESTVYNYMRGTRQPSLKLLVKIADCFSCSVDYLLGRVSEYGEVSYCACPPFPQQLAFLMKYFGVNKYKLCKEVPVTHSVIYAWQSGHSVPTLDYAVKLADYFHCSVDFILGREI